jgi:hypothetical protein
LNRDECRLNARQNDKTLATPVHILAFTFTEHSQSSKRITMTTVSKGPNRIANTGAMSMPDPTPTNPRMKPATTVTQIAITKLVFPTMSVSGRKFIVGPDYLVELRNGDCSCRLTSSISDPALLSPTASGFSNTSVFIMYSIAQIRQSAVYLQRVFAVRSRSNEAMGWKWSIREGQGV